jgi:PPK2 family polyphosphate:nucleotide phosphotransferase
MRLKPIPNGTEVELDDEAAAPPHGAPEGKKLKEETDALLERFADLSTALRAERTRALLVVLQARDAGGKDGTIRRVFGAVSPQYLEVRSFAAPTRDELAHDFLWRVHRVVPQLGMVGVFNRSHYEDVLAARVHHLVPKEVWHKRYGHIEAFERLLSDSGVTIVKLFLHVSRAEQKKRFLERLQKRRKGWKFQEGDLDDRRLWDEYTHAYRDAIAKTSTDSAPWYVVPADDKPTRDLLVARIVVDALERMDPQFPQLDPKIVQLADTID